MVLKQVCAILQWQRSSMVRSGPSTGLHRPSRQTWHGLLTSILQRQWVHSAVLHVLQLFLVLLGVPFLHEVIELAHQRICMLLLGIPLLKVLAVSWCFSPKQARSGPQWNLWVEGGHRKVRHWRLFISIGLLQPILCQLAWAARVHFQPRNWLTNLSMVENLSQVHNHSIDGPSTRQWVLVHSHMQVQKCGHCSLLCLFLHGLDAQFLHSFRNDSHGIQNVTLRQSLPVSSGEVRRQAVQRGSFGFQLQVALCGHWQAIHCLQNIILDILRQLSSFHFVVEGRQCASSHVSNIGEPLLQRNQASFSHLRVGPLHQEVGNMLELMAKVFSSPLVSHCHLLGLLLARFEPVCH